MNFIGRNTIRKEGIVQKRKVTKKKGWIFYILTDFLLYMKNIFKLFLSEQLIPISSPSKIIQTLNF